MTLFIGARLHVDNKKTRPYCKHYFIRLSINKV